MKTNNYELLYNPHLKFDKVAFSNCLNKIDCSIFEDMEAYLRPRQLYAIEDFEPNMHDEIMNGLMVC